MNAPQENAVSSFSAIDAVFAKYQARWTPIAAFVAGVTRFRSRVTNINSLIQAQHTPTKGVTEGKRTSRESMIAGTLEVAGCVAAYAFDNGDAELQAKMDYSETDLLRIRDGAIGPVCQGVHDDANKVVADLTDYSVTATVLAALQQKITDYSGDVGKPRSATSSKKAAGKSLDGEIVATRELLDKKMDKLAAKFKASDPDFYNEYVAARVIVDNPGGRKGKNGDNHQPQPPQ